MLCFVDTIESHHHIKVSVYLILSVGQLPLLLAAILIYLTVAILFNQVVLGKSTATQGCIMNFLNGTLNRKHGSASVTQVIVMYFTSVPQFHLADVWHIGANQVSMYLKPHCLFEKICLHAFMFWGVQCGAVRSLNKFTNFIIPIVMCVTLYWNASPHIGCEK